MLGFGVDVAEDVHHVIRDRVLAEAVPLEAPLATSST